MITNGKHENYYWLETFDPEFNVHKFLNDFKTTILDKIIIITSFDCGPLTLTDSELNNGWKYVNSNAMSPLIRTETEVPNDNYDEWYIFDSIPLTFNSDDNYVANDSFMLGGNNIDIQSAFWNNIRMNNPETYISCGNSFKIVTLKEELIKLIEKHWCQQRAFRNLLLWGTKVFVNLKLRAAPSR